MVDSGALVIFIHAVAISDVGEVFDRTRPEIVQYDCDSVLSEALPCISVFDSETGAEGWRPALSSLDVLCKIPFLPRAHLIFSSVTTLEGTNSLTFSLSQ